MFRPPSLHAIMHAHVHWPALQCLDINPFVSPFSYVFNSVLLRITCAFIAMDEAGVILEALHFAADKHRDQRRKDAVSTPYINHPVSVAYLLWKEGKITDIPTLQAGILHDILEDTATEESELIARFGKEVTDIVKECSDDKSLAKWERKKYQIEAAPLKSYKAKLVSLADKLHNLQDIDTNPPPSWSEERIHHYFTWSAQVVNGMRDTNQQLEKMLESLFQKRGLSMLTPNTNTSCDYWKQF